ncbi:MAG TPA: CopY/TcrY family copper transport repressor [Candidatus Limosilactobacillus merdigallinarum]|uniref:CopY/TcrY family copper transport repressor n=1 Tax=Candidatus Limosilactobacillus merdigallinarum TaxID=2838652 RepID=A0A9D2AKA5_9LACO|nr:CopY/TcrY family copper transport repressor [Candidatus Limosilactobacillus merdigallinarum]
METNTDISPAEWQVMRVIWTLNEATSAQVIEILQRKEDWQSATIKTLLHRLVKKGALKTTRHGRAFIYQPLVKEQTTMNDAVDQLFSSICQMHAGKSLIHVIEHTELSKQDIASLQDLLAKKAVDAPETVKCNCVPGMDMNC